MDSTRTYKTIFTYGWHESLAKQFEPYENLGYIPMRIVRQGRGLYRGVSGDASLLLELSGSFLNLQDLGIQQSPVVGDWCAVRQYASDRGRIEAVLPRMNVLHRPVAHDRQGSNGVEGLAKLVAANIDMAAIIQDCRYDFNLRRIERFISLLHTDSIPAILVLTKIDLVEDPEAYRLRGARTVPAVSGVPGRFDLGQRYRFPSGGVAPNDDHSAARHKRRGQIHPGQPTEWTRCGQDRRYPHPGRSWSAHHHITAHAPASPWRADSRYPGNTSGRHERLPGTGARCIHRHFGPLARLQVLGLHAYRRTRLPSAPGPSGGIDRTGPILQLPQAGQRSAELGRSGPATQTKEESDRHVAIPPTQGR